MRKIGLIGVMGLILAAASVRAATVIYRSQRIVGSVSNRQITYALRTDPELIRTNLTLGTPMICQPTNGVSVTNLVAGGYNLKIDGLNSLIPFDVPDSTNTYEIGDLINHSIYYLVTGTNALGANVEAGSNIIVGVSSDGVHRTVSLVNSPTLGALTVSNGAGTPVITLDGPTATAKISTLIVTNISVGPPGIGVGSMVVGEQSVQAAPAVIPMLIQDLNDFKNVAISHGTVTASNLVGGVLTGNPAGLSNATTQVSGIMASNDYAGSIMNDGWSSTVFKTAPMLLNTFPVCSVNVTASCVTNAINDILKFSNYGWEGVLIDDGWQSPNRTNGVITSDNTKFPSGMTNLVSWIHSLGLKVGIYHGLNNTTDGGSMGSQLTNWLADAKFFVACGFDFMRLEIYDPPARQFVQYLQAQRQPMTIEMIAETGNGWNAWYWGKGGMFAGLQNGSDRTWAGDGTISYSDMLLYLDGTESGMNMTIPGKYLTGYFMLLLSIGTYDEGRTMASMWAMRKIGLQVDRLIGGGNTNLNVTCKDVWAILKDPMGICAYSQSKSNGATAQVWIDPIDKPTIEGGRIAVAFQNRSNNFQNVTCTLTNIIGFTNIVTAYDCWSNCWVGYFTNFITVTPPAHGTELWTLTPGIVPPLNPARSYYASDLNWIGTSTNGSNTDPYGLKKDRTYDNNGPPNIAGVAYSKCIAGIGPARIDYFVGGTMDRFVAVMGADFNNIAFNPPTNRCKVFADGNLVFTSSQVTNFQVVAGSGAMAFAPVIAPISGANVVTIIMEHPNGTGSANDRFILGNAAFIGSESIQKTTVRTTEIGFGTGPTATLSTGNQSPANSFYAGGFSVAGASTAQFAFQVPNNTITAFFEIPMQVLANSMWTNNLNPGYNSVTTDNRILSGGVENSWYVVNTATSMVACATWPVTNAPKYIFWTMNAASNSTTRYFDSPWTVSYTK